MVASVSKRGLKFRSSHSGALRKKSWRRASARRWLRVACCSSSGKWIMEMAMILRKSRAEEQEGKGAGEIKIKNKMATLRHGHD